MNNGPKIPTKEEFIKNTEQFHYACDAGSLGILVHGVDIGVLNCTGDGEGTVYITDKMHFELPAPSEDELILTLGKNNYCVEYLTIGLRALDIETWQEPELKITAREFSISRIKGTNDFIIRVEGRKEEPDADDNL